MPLSRHRKFTTARERREAKRRKVYRKTVHAARVAAIRGDITLATFANVREWALRRLMGVRNIAPVAVPDVPQAAPAPTPTPRRGPIGIVRRLANQLRLKTMRALRAS